MDIGASRIFFSFICNQLIQHKNHHTKKDEHLSNSMLFGFNMRDTDRLLTLKSNDKLNSITSTQNLFENVVRLGPKEKKNNIETLMKVVVSMEGILAGGVTTLNATTNKRNRITICCPVSS